MTKEEREIQEAAKSRPGDHWGRFWPSDELRNISADARVLAKHASLAFRRALTPESS